jgi:hypothetical protein
LLKEKNLENSAKMFALNFVNNLSGWGQILTLSSNPVRRLNDLTVSFIRSEFEYPLKNKAGNF